MNKRQLKKKQKKYLPIIADEYNLLTMTEEERQQAYKECDEYRKKYGYRKKYKDLKGNYLNYYYPVGKEHQERMSRIISTLRSKPIKFMIVEQKFKDLEHSYE